MTHLEIFDQHRSLLFGLAYRMLGSVSEAEDILQEAFLRWFKAAPDPAEVQSPKAYLSTIVTRLCLDQLRSAQAQREVYVGPWLPEPLLTTDQADSPGAALELADSLSLAFLVLLESLTPLERAVFVLREVFDYEYAEIAQIVGKTEANCRQLVKRGRQHVQERRPRYAVSAQQQEAVMQKFLTACTGGNLGELMQLLTDDVVVLSDGGGKVLAARNPITGADNVARFLLGLVKKMPADLTLHLSKVNGQPALLAYAHDAINTVLTLDIFEGQVRSVQIVVNPDKLKSIPALTEL